MRKNIQIQPLTQESFSAFGNVIEKENHDFFRLTKA